jgi:hypothetical protein
MPTSQERELNIFGFTEPRWRRGVLIGILTLVSGYAILVDIRNRDLNQQLLAAKEQVTVVTEKLLREQMGADAAMDSIRANQLRILFELQRTKEEVAILQKKRGR